MMLGNAIYLTGDFAGAMVRVDAAVAGFRELGEAAGLSIALNILGDIAFAAGELTRSAACLEEAHALQRELDYGWGIMGSLWGLANLAFGRGDVAQAMSLYRESLAQAHAHGNARNVAYALPGLAGVAAAWGQPERAARLLGATEAQIEVLGITVFPSDRMVFGRVLAATRAGLPDDALAAAWAAGRALSLDEAVAEAMAVADGPAAVDAESTGLTRREIEVLRLVAASRTDQEIADALFVSRRTVNTHVSSILAKLGVDTRREAAALALERRLV
jgi:non-specific serine/threonine protein kinase